MRNALEWLIQPFASGGALAARALRIGTVVGLLALVVVPWLQARNGADGWLWNVTLAVLLGVTLSATVADALFVALGGRSPALRVLSLHLGVVVGMAAGYVVPVLLGLGPLPETDVLVRDFERNLGVVLAVALAATLATAVAWYRSETYRLEALAAQSRLDTLEAQLRPHFLFNALGSLKELVETDPRRASEATQALADLYRAILEASGKETIPLEDELALVRAYLAVESVRYGDRLRVDVAEPDREDARTPVPPLLLQTLAENAIKHGITKARAGGHVRVRTRREGARMEITVENGGAPLTPSPRTGGPAPRGLENARARLALLFGDRASLELTSEGGETRARVCLPRREAP